MSNKVIDLTPAILDLVLYAGDAEDFEVEFKNPDQEAIDVSRFTWTSQIRKTRKAETSFDLEIDATNASTGSIRIHISPEITRALPLRNQWDLQATSSDSPDDPTSVLQGSVMCVQDVTREDVTP